MPTYEIQAPNGKKYHIEGPPGASTDEVRAEVLRQFPEAEGDTRGTSWVKKPPAPQAPPVAQVTAGDAASSAGKDVIGGLGKGLATIPDILSSMGNYATRGITMGGAAIADPVLRGLGATGAADRVAQEGDDARMGRGGYAPITLGGMIEQTMPTEQSGPGSTARMLSEFAGGALVPFGGPKAPNLAKFPVQAAEDVAVPTAARDIISAGKQAGVRVLTSDVKPPATFIGKNIRSIGEKIPFAGTGGIRAEQQAERVASVKNILRDFGGDDAVHLFDDAPGAIQDVAKNLSERRSKELTRLTSTKNAIINGTDGAVPTPMASKAIDGQIAHLKGINDEAFAPVISKLESFKAQLSSGKTLSQIEGNRKLLGDLFSDPSLASIKGDGQKALNAIYGPLREDMGAYIETVGGKAARARWAKANDELAAMAGELGNSKLRSVLKTSDMTPENVGKLLFSANRSDVARLYDNLDDFGKSRAQAAVLQRAFDKAVSADGGLSVERFVSNLKAMGGSVGVTFKGPDQARVQGLARLLEATRQGSAASVAPPTGVQNMPAAAGYTLGSLFGQAAIPIAATGGLFARAYESAPVRNLLVKVSRTEPGSKQEARLLRDIVGLLPSETAVGANNLPKALNDNVGVAASAGNRPEQQRKQQGGLQP